MIASYEMSIFSGIKLRCQNLLYVASWLGQKFDNNNNSIFKDEFKNLQF